MTLNYQTKVCQADLNILGIQFSLPPSEPVCFFVFVFFLTGGSGWNVSRMPRPHPHSPHFKSQKKRKFHKPTYNPPILPPASHTNPSSREPPIWTQSAPWPSAIFLAKPIWGTSFPEEPEFLESTSPELQAHKPVVNHTRRFHRKPPSIAHNGDYPPDRVLTTDTHYSSCWL